MTRRITMMQMHLLSGGGVAPPSTIAVADAPTKKRKMMPGKPERTAKPKSAPPADSVRPTKESEGKGTTKASSVRLG